MLEAATWKTKNGSMHRENDLSDTHLLLFSVGPRGLGANEKHHGLTTPAE